MSNNQRLCEPLNLLCFRVSCLLRAGFAELQLPVTPDLRPLTSLHSAAAAHLQAGFHWLDGSRKHLLLTARRSARCLQANDAPGGGGGA